MQACAKKVSQSINSKDIIQSGGGQARCRTGTHKDNCLSQFASTKLSNKALLTIEDSTNNSRHVEIKENLKQECKKLLKATVM